MDIQQNKTKQKNFANKTQKTQNKQQNIFMSLTMFHLLDDK